MTNLRPIPSVKIPPKSVSSVFYPISVLSIVNRKTREVRRKKSEAIRVLVTRNYIVLSYWLNKIRAFAAFTEAGYLKLTLRSL